MKLLLTDAHSPLGHAIGFALESETFSLLRPVEGEVNWCDSDQVQDYLKAQRPDIVINTLGWSEAPVPEQQGLLVEAARCLALGCEVIDAVPIHLSSYRVFGGENKSSYDEDDPVHPLCAEGTAFAKAEQFFTAHLEKWICLRLSWLIGAQGDNLLTSVLNALADGKEFEASNELRGVPTSDGDVARVVVALVKQIACGSENWGVFHYCSADACSQAEFARQVEAIMEQEGFAGCVTEKEGAAEPESGLTRAVLNCRRCRDNFGVQLRSWRQGLHSTIKAWLREHSED